MADRTKTYILADWKSDKDAVDQLFNWNSDAHWNLELEYTCSDRWRSQKFCHTKLWDIKTKLDISKTFVLIIGENTKDFFQYRGKCHLCSGYPDWALDCIYGAGKLDFRNFLDYACEETVQAGLKIVVLYKATTVDKTRCPEAVKDIGTHAAMFFGTDEEPLWDYESVKNALEIVDSDLLSFDI